MAKPKAFFALHAAFNPTLNIGKAKATFKGSKIPAIIAGVNEPLSKSALIFLCISKFSFRYCS